MLKYLLITTLFSVIMISCNETRNSTTSVAAYEPPPDIIPPDTTGNNPDTTITTPEQIFITDQSGKKWNITHAVQEYGFEPSGFQFGLGPFAIRPINNPVFIERDENGFPDATNTMQIIGTTIENESRAYPLSTLRSYEILNDVFGEEHVAIGF